MPHAIAIEEDYQNSASTSQRKPKARSPRNRELQSLHAHLETVQSIYSDSSFRETLSRTLVSSLRAVQTPITSILSLGLGSLSSNRRGKTRRLKQLAIMLAIRDELQVLSSAEIIVYAQDPVFTKHDEIFLSSLNILILRTTSGSSLGEASSLLSASTLVYSPFLTLEAYEAIFSAEPMPLQVFISDDFNALRAKWPRYSDESGQVERLIKGAVSRYRRRAIIGTGFWEEEDQSFPLAVYAMERKVREKARI